MHSECEAQENYHDMLLKIGVDAYQGISEVKLLMNFN